MFCYEEHFEENEKDRNHLVQGVMNIVDGVEQTNLNSIFSLRESSVIIEEHNVTLLMSAGAFSKGFPSVEIVNIEVKH